MCAGGPAAQRYAEPRRGCTKSAPRPLEDKVSPTNVEDNEQCIERGRPDLYVWLRGPERVQRRSLASPGPAIETTKSGSGRRHARGRLTGRAVDADRRTAGGASPARPPRRRRHHLRSPGTSPAMAAARRPRSAPGSPSTVPASSPAARDASPEDERRSAAGRSPIAVPDFQIRRGLTTLCSAGRTSSLREAYGS